jgi:hypothetical protein
MQEAPGLPSTQPLPDLSSIRSSSEYQNNYHRLSQIIIAQNTKKKNCNLQHKQGKETFSRFGQALNQMTWKYCNNTKLLRRGNNASTPMPAR